MDAILLQILNGLDKGGAYALIALGLTITFGTLGIVNFAHGALFMLGAFCAVSIKALLGLERVTEDPSQLTAWGTPMEVRVPYVEAWFGDFGATLLDYSVPVSILAAIPVMLLIGVAMERGLIRFFYKRPHADQILVTFGLAIVLQEIVKSAFGANPIPQPAPDAARSMIDFGAALGFDPGNVVYPVWRLIYFLFSVAVITAVFAFLQFTTFGMVVRAGMADRETVGLLGIDVDRRFTIVSGIAAVVAGLARLMYTADPEPRLPHRHGFPGPELRPRRSRRISKRMNVAFSRGTVRYDESAGNGAGRIGELDPSYLGTRKAALDRIERMKSADSASRRPPDD